MQDEERWKAVINSDKCYDGLFYYAVKTTKIFCRPSCKAKIPLRKNTFFFNSYQEALKEGFRPCKLCRPDISDVNFNSNKVLIDKFKKVLDENYDKGCDIVNIAHQFGFSERHLSRLFKEYIGITPKEYIKELKINNSKILLKSTSMGIADIAYEVGFKSISNFYKCFNEVEGVTPKKYREKL